MRKNFKRYKTPILTISLMFTTILLSDCAQKQFYTVCPVSVPNAWKKAPDGGLQYRRLKNGIYACNKTTMVCAVTVSDFKIVAENMQKCEHARQGLVDLFDAIDDPKLRDEYGQTYPQAKISDMTPTEALIPDDAKDVLKQLEKLPIVDPRVP